MNHCEAFGKEAEEAGTTIKEGHNSKLATKYFLLVLNLALYWPLTWLEKPVLEGALRIRVSRRGRGAEGEASWSVPTSWSGHRLPKSESQGEGLRRKVCWVLRVFQRRKDGTGLGGEAAGRVHVLLRAQTEATQPQAFISPCPGTDLL